MTTITERVTAGAAYLDEHDPEWWRADVERAINVNTLRMSKPYACILGQRCPLEVLAKYLGHRFGLPARDVPDAEDFSFWAFASALSGLPAGTERDDNDDADGPIVTWSSGLGFNSPIGSTREFNDLADEWIRVITERRAAS